MNFRRFTTGLLCSVFVAGTILGCGGGSEGVSEVSDVADPTMESTMGADGEVIIEDGDGTGNVDADVGAGTPAE